MDLGNLAGMQDWRFFGIVPSFVNTKRLPGMSKPPEPTVIKFMASIPGILIQTPNFIWYIVSLSFYTMFPYDLSSDSTAARAPLSVAFFQERLPPWASLVLGYVSFIHLSIYWWGWADRPYIQNRPYKIDKVAHNIFWTSSGVVIWVGFENVFAYLWSTGRLRFIADTFDSVNLLQLAAVSILIPAWRNIHFYFAHRLLHFGPLYQQVHALHHRNTDIEPFAGLCMHPMEHLYYFACVLPSLVFTCSPFAFMWNGIHLLLSPAASHSGYEDHWQSDQLHYIHHRYFECNYAGGDTAFMDILFGTYRDSMEDELVGKKDGGPKGLALRADAKSTLWGAPKLEFVVYLAASGACLAAWATAALNVAAGASVARNEAYLLAALAGVGPVAAAVLVSAVFKTASNAAAKPQRASVLGRSLHLFAGALCCSLPVSWACYLALTSQGL